jgi:outer membrane protein OmpA-like peptidoglycan-associated protein
MNPVFYMSKKLFCLPILIVFFCFGCSMKAGKTIEPNNLPLGAENKNSAVNTNENVQTKAPANIANDAKNSADGKDLLSFFSGALIVKKTAEYGSGWTAENAIDENPESGWSSPENEISNQNFVIELPEKSVLKTLSFDTAFTENEDRGAKEITVEISDAGADSGFQEIARVSLKNKLDDQRFPVSKEIAGRFVRVSFGANEGSAGFVELMNIRGFGQQLTTTPLENVSGTYTSDFGDFHIKQVGTSVIGCYEHENGLLKGGIEDRIMKLNWSEDGGDKGPAVMVFTADGKKMVGRWWEKSQDVLKAVGGQWNGMKKSNDVGACPNLPNLSKASAAQNQITDDLKKNGRATVYGINFDTGSDVIKPESKTVLDEIVALLKENKDWKMTVEGHTDNVGGADYNRQLSGKRAAAVKDFLVKAGIEAARLNSAGFGMSKPVASNESTFGRAQNRRVELVKN